MKILITGSREWTNTEIIKNAIEFHSKPSEDTIIIHGGAKGADAIADQLAIQFGWSRIIYPANWTLHGKSAGPTRNKFMLVSSKPDVVLAFPTTSSRGTWDCVNTAKLLNLKVVLYEEQGDSLCLKP